MDDKTTDVIKTGGLKPEWRSQQESPPIDDAKRKRATQLEKALLCSETNAFGRTSLVPYADKRKTWDKQQNGEGEWKRWNNNNIRQSNWCENQQISSKQTTEIQLQKFCKHQMHFK